MSTAKEARRDAYELARAQMFFGEGAGNRRKLIQTTVQSKMDNDRDGVYTRALMKEIDAQDMAEHAQAARKERRKIDRNETIRKNTRGLLLGNPQSVQTGLLLAAAVGYVAHQTGYDKIAYNKGRELYGKAKAKYKSWRAEQAVHTIHKLDN